MTAYDPTARNDALIATLDKKRGKLDGADAEAFDAGQAARAAGKERNPNPYRHLIGGPGITQATAYWEGWDLANEKTKPVA